jgi:maleate isomerase
MLDHRIGLIIPSINRMTEPQFQTYTPPGVGVYVTRLRMTGKWHRPLSALEDDICHAAQALSDVDPAVIVFHCTASSMEKGLRGETEVVQWIREASGCAAITTGQAVCRALTALGIHRLVIISPYVEQTNLLEVRYMEEAGFEVIHEFGLGLTGGDSYTRVTPEEWHDLVLEHRRSEADGYFLSCTNTRMIEAIENCEQDLDRPVVTSNQATLWACLSRLEQPQRLSGLGRLFQPSAGRTITS